MGSYDEVEVPCPKCGKIALFQSKGGSCSLNTYSLKNCPADVMTDVNRHSPYRCSDCGTSFEVHFGLSAEYVGVIESKSICMVKGCDNVRHSDLFCKDCFSRMQNPNHIISIKRKQD